MALSKRVRRHIVDLISTPNTIPFGLQAMAPATAAPPPRRVPDELTPREYALLLLHIAAGIEHALMVQYLFAGYSLGGPQVLGEHREMVLRWQEIILGIAKEEMGHLMTVQNLLRCLGGSLTLDRGDFPWDSEFYPFEFRLEPLSGKSLAKYIVTESPDDGSFHGPEADAIRKLAQEDSQGAPVNRVGALYDLLHDIFTDPAIVPDVAFRDDTFLYQANWDEWGRSYRAGARGASRGGNISKTPDMLVLPVTSRSDALSALRQVATQGEAPLSAGESPASHFARFLAIFREFPDAEQWQPARNVAVNPVAVNSHTANPAPGTTPIHDKEANLWAHLLNLRYRSLLTNLLHTFDYTNQLVDGSQFTPRGMLIHATFGEMYNVRAISEILMQMPVSASSATMAGPPFEMPYTLALPRDPVDRWNLQGDLLRASCRLTSKLLKSSSSPHQDYLHLLHQTDQETMRRIEAVAATFARPF